MGDLSYLFGLWRFEDEEAMRSIFRRRLPSTLDDILAGEVYDSVSQLSEYQKRILLRRLAASVGSTCQWCRGLGWKYDTDYDDSVMKKKIWKKCHMCTSLGYRDFGYEDPKKDE